HRSCGPTLALAFGWWQRNVAPARLRGVLEILSHKAREMPDHGRLRSWDRYGQRLARGRSELDDVRAIILRPVDHDPVLARHRHFFSPHSSSASRFTAGAFAFFILRQSGERPER